MIAKIYSAIPFGYDGHLIEVEGSITKGLPTFNIVGMANKTISEARERVRSAITHSDLSFPSQKVTISLAPAELTKDGSHLDLPIALTILILSGQLLQSDLEHKLFIGELSLNGLTKPVRGIINVVETAKQAGFSEVYVPEADYPYATLIPGIQIYAVSSLTELFLHLKGVKPIQNPSAPITPVLVKNTQTDTTEPTLDQIREQEFAKRALAIAIAGHHNLLLSGPPGAGKTLLARTAANLLPNPSPAEQTAIAKIHSLSLSTPQIPQHRPFRSPHHTASNISIIGGGTQASPGEISLAHHGILFLDELPEYPRTVLESLRQPLEDKTITIARASQHVTYPADFMLIATMNPCPCGYYNDPDHECTCTISEIEKYHKKLSGPILDRIDLIVTVEKVKHLDLLPNPNLVNNTKTDINAKRHPPQHVQHPNHVKNTKTDIKEHLSNPQHTKVKNNITDAIKRQFARYQKSGKFNSSLSSHEVSQYITLQPSAKQLLDQATSALNLSARAYFKVIKVAQTIADLDGKTEVSSEHISESLSFRRRNK